MPKKAIQHRPSARKKPKQTRSLETVRVIVEAAARVLEASGLEGFSTNAVAAYAGVSVGSVYQYFPDKEALIGALIVRETSLLIEQAERALSKRSGASALKVLIQSAIAHQFRRPVLARVLDFEEARLPFDANTQQVNEQFQAIALDILLRPDLPPQRNYDIAAQDVMAIIKGIVDTAGVRAESYELELASRVENAVFGYLEVSGRNQSPNRASKT